MHSRVALALAAALCTLLAAWNVWVSSFVACPMTAVTTLLAMSAVAWTASGGNTPIHICIEALGAAPWPALATRAPSTHASQRGHGATLRATPRGPT